MRHARRSARIATSIARKAGSFSQLDTRINLVAFAGI
jgi:hypothetical protein